MENERILFICYGNTRSAILEATAKMQLKRLGHGYDVLSRGIPKYTTEGKGIKPEIIQVAHEIDPILGEMLANKRLSAARKEDLEAYNTQSLIIDSYLNTELRGDGLIKTGNLATVLQFADIPEVEATDMDDAWESVQRRTAKYVEQRKIADDEKFQYISISGTPYVERTHEAYGAMIKDCLTVSTAVLTKLGNSESG